MRARAFLANNLLGIAEIAAAVYVGDHLATRLQSAKNFPFSSLPDEFIDVAVALAAAIVIVVLREFVFARPVLRVLWIEEGRELPHENELVAMNFDSHVQALRWSLHLQKEVESLTAEWVLRFACWLGLRLQVTFSPPHAVRASVNRLKSGKARAYEGRIIFDLRSMSFDAGVAEWASVTFEPGNLPASRLEVKCSYRLLFNRRISILARPLIHVVGNVSTLSVAGRATQEA